VALPPTTVNISLISTDGAISGAPSSYSQLYAITGTGDVVPVTVPEPTSKTSVVFDGQGWGHNVGMSQWGARGLAELGYTYQDILYHYFVGTKIEQY